VLLASIAAAGAGSPLVAQAPRYLIAGEAALARLQNTASPAGALQGMAIGGMGHASVWRLELDARYGEGKLEQSGTGALRDLVEGEVMLGIRVVPWLSLRGGPQLRGFLVGGITERWLLWEARVRVDAFVAPRAIRGYLEVGGAVSGNTRNADGPFGNSRRGEAGMAIRFPRAPIWLSLSYAVERTRLASNTGLDALEHFTASLGIGADR
jgi:hypothetical protein